MDASSASVSRAVRARGARARCRARRNEAEEMFRGAFDAFAAASLRAIGGVASDVVGGGERDADRVSERTARGRGAGVGV